MCLSTSLTRRLIVIAITCQVLAAAPAALGSSAAGAYLDKNNGKFRKMLSTISVDDKALDAMRGILVVPSDAAVDSLASSMGMSVQQLLSNPLLVDQITAYHFMPNVKVTKDLKLPSVPLITKTAEPHYIVRFFKDPKTNKAWLLDMQGNKVPLKQQPVVFGDLTLVPLDKVLMSGSYYKSFADALKLHGQFAKAGELFQRAQGFANTAQASDSTLLVPVDKAFDSSKVSVSALSQTDSRNVLQYHAIPSAKPADQLQSGTKATLLSGHDVKINTGFSGEVQLPSRPERKVKKPAVTVTDEAGNKADVTLLNIWAGKGVMHGINKVLQAKPASTSVEKAATAGSTAKPGDAAASKTGRRHLLMRAWVVLNGAADMNTAGSVFGVTPPRRNRKLLQNPPTPDYAQSNPATALLAENTVAAAYAANAKAQNAYYALPDSPGWAPMNQWSNWESNA